MENIIQHFIQPADLVPGIVNVLSTLVAVCSETLHGLFDATLQLLVQATPETLLPTGCTLAFAAAGVTGSAIPEETLAIARRWHGSIDEQFGNIDNLVLIIQAHGAWGTPPQFTQITTNRTQLAALIPKCRSGSGSTNDRGQRNFLLKTTVGICLTNVKLWAYAQYNTNPATFTLYDLHSLGFLLPGEISGHHGRSVATEVVAEVKVSVLSADVIRAVIDQAAENNAALTAHGWPTGVHQALIVITAADGKTEVYRQHTTRLHNEIQMPEGSHGQQFVIKAAFLKHPDDAPVFGPQPTFTMPFSTEDLADILDRQHHEEFESHIREVESLRRELEQLRQKQTSNP
ncbi:MAG: hypothetical protein LBF89_00400 [Bacteroidales bacterium]|jgi:hypothetical protein|nr:hypothetical protein [Bacteroidales bacterium]